MRTEQGGITSYQELQSLMMASRDSPVLMSHLNFSIFGGKPEAEAEVLLLWGTLAVGRVIREALPHEMLATF